MIRRKPIALVFCTLLLVSLFVMSSGYWARAFAVGLIQGQACDETLLSAAKERNEQFLGSVRSEPLIYCVDNPLLGLSVSYGQASFAPFMPTVIILGPEGRNADVTAHEWMHAEVARDLGFFRSNLRLPTWLSEGFAMQVDHRNDYSSAALTNYLRREDLVLNDLKFLSSPGNFYRGGDQGKFHYTFSKCVVGKWLDAERERLPSELLQSVVHNFKPTLPQDFDAFAEACLASG